MYLGCVLSPYFIILVNETDQPTQYLYDPYSVNDDALSFTQEPKESLIFSDAYWA